MAEVRYCILNSSTFVCTDVIIWDNVNTYTPASGTIVAGDNTGAIGWTYPSGTSPGGMWTYPNGTLSIETVYEPLQVVDGGTGVTTLDALKTLVGSNIDEVFYDMDGGAAATKNFALTIDFGSA